MPPPEDHNHRPNEEDVADVIAVSRVSMLRLHRRLDDQDGVLKEIRSAVVGNAELGHKGFVERLKNVETDLQGKAYKSEVTELKKKVDGHERRFWIASGGLAVLMFFKELLFSAHK